MIRPTRNIDQVRLTPAEVDVRTRLKKADISEETLRRLAEARNPDVPFVQRVREFLRAENDLGKAARVLKHGVILLTPFGRSVETAAEFAEDVLLPETKRPKPMLQRILSIKNFINVRDEDGNFSWAELGASVIQLLIAGAVVWGAQQLGLWSGLQELISG